MYASEVIAGGVPGDVTLARHVSLIGTQRKIGHDQMVGRHPTSDPPAD